jgi:hypothetical protein
MGLLYIYKRYIKKKGKCSTFYSLSIELHDEMETLLKAKDEKEVLFWKTKIKYGQNGKHLYSGWFPWILGIVWSQDIFKHKYD